MEFKKIDEFFKINIDEGTEAALKLIEEMKYEQELVKRVFSNVLEEEKKIIKNVEIKKIKISINSKIKRAIEQLEILENYDEIEDVDKNSMIRLYRTIAEEKCMVM